MKVLNVIYSHMCEANGAFLGQLEEWLMGTEIQINLIPFYELTAEATQWYKAEGLLSNEGGFLSSVFIDVFYEGKLIDSVPLNKKKIEKALEVALHEPITEPIKDRLSMNAETFRSLVGTSQIKWEPIDSSNYRAEMQMCLTNYPYGNPAERFHDRCIRIKDQVFKEVFQLEDIAGIFGTYQNKIIGLLEVFPREILKRNGFLTGSFGADFDYLTVGCLEVGFGTPRKEMIDELFYQLEQKFPRFRRKRIEGIGVLEWNEGFTPYWVYDKYDYKKTELITSKKMVMAKSIHE